MAYRVAQYIYKSLFYVKKYIKNISDIISLKKIFFVIFLFVFTNTKDKKKFVRRM